MRHLSDTAAATAVLCEAVQVYLRNYRRELQLHVWVSVLLRRYAAAQ